MRVEYILLTRDLLAAQYREPGGAGHFDHSSEYDREAGVGVEVVLCQQSRALVWVG